MIEALVSDLPEIYQPIHGHPELSGRVSRSCADRLEQIAHIHDALQRLLGRPLKVLDLGCAQGFFSLNLAERGAIVHGVDYLDKNIAVCNALARESPSLRVDFETGRVEEVIARLETGQYDLVLGLSVFHHIIHEKGADSVKAMLGRAAEQSGALVVELALREEPLYWAPAQPEDPRDLLRNIAFVHEVARYETHLAAIPRPLFVASSRLWVLADQASQFDRWSLDPHSMAHGTHQASRRYYHGKDRILKLYRLDHPRGKHNKTEFTNEVSFLQKPPKGFWAPVLISYGENDTSAWIDMQRLSGRLLLDMLREGRKVDGRAIVLAVLDQLAALEEAGLYHNDVRTWNVLIAEDGATHLIDYGSISPKARDCVWPGNLFLSFLIFVREVVTGVVDDPVPLRTVSISPYSLPQPYCNWATALWQRPLSEWSFRLLRDNLLETSTEAIETTLLDANGAWMNAIEEAVQTQKIYVNQILRQVEDFSAKEAAESQAKVAEAWAEKVAAESRTQVAEAQAEKVAAESRAQVAEAQVEKVAAESRAQVAEAQAEKVAAESRAQVAEAQVEKVAAESRAQVAEAQAEKVAAESRAQVAEAQAEKVAAESRAQVAEAQVAKAHQLAAQLAATQKELHDVHQSNHHHWQQWEATKQELHAVHQLNHHHWELAETRQQALQAIQSSWSWRITAPLRWVAAPFLQRGGTRAVPPVLTFSDRAIRWGMAQPRLVAAVHRAVARYPGLRAAITRRVAVAMPSAPSFSVPSSSDPSSGKPPPELANLPPRARQIYTDLKSALARRQQEHA